MNCVNEGPEGAEWKGQAVNGMEGAETVAPIGCVEVCVECVDCTSHSIQSPHGATGSSPSPC